MKNMGTRLTKEHLEQIGEYIAEKYPAIKSRSRSYSRDFEMDIRERIVRVEEELKNQREILNIMLSQMDKRFELSEKRFEQMEKRLDQIDKRFEQVDKRFEQVDKRFEEMRTDMDRGFRMLMWFTGLGFTVVTSFITGVFIFLK